MKRFKVVRVLGFILLVVAGIFICGSAVMLLWNALLPALFHFPLITFWQALGLLLLSKLLFGGFRGGFGRGGHWKNRMRQKWQNMTPEEREKFRNEWKSRCGHGLGNRFPDKSGE